MSTQPHLSFVNTEYFYQKNSINLVSTKTFANQINLDDDTNFHKRHLPDNNLLPGCQYMTSSIDSDIITPQKDDADFYNFS